LVGLRANPTFQAVASRIATENQLKTLIFRLKPISLVTYYIIITLIERVLGELIFIYYGMLPPDVSSIF
jgi:hypothetical protein